MKLHTIVSLVFGACVAASSIGNPVSSSETGSTTSPKVGLARLSAGNQRFVAGTMQHPGQTAQRRSELAQGQHPFAVVLTCADSRVCPEIIFDQGMGDLFVIRIAGNVTDDHVLGSIEYAVEHLHVPLVIVLGHSQCGAVAAAASGGKAPGHIQSLIESLAPAVAEAQKQKGDVTAEAVRINAQRVAAALAHSEPIIADLVKARKVTIRSACYDLASGAVNFIP